jgi:hypothetical protein
MVELATPTFSSTTYPFLRIIVLTDDKWWVPWCAPKESSRPTYDGNVYFRPMFKYNHSKDIIYMYKYIRKASVSMLRVLTQECSNSINGSMNQKGDKKLRPKSIGI